MRLHIAFHSKHEKGFIVKNQSSAGRRHRQPACNQNTGAPLLPQNTYKLHLTVTHHCSIKVCNYSEKQALVERKGSSRGSTVKQSDDLLYLVNDGPFQPIFSQPPIWWMNTLFRPNLSIRGFPRYNRESKVSITDKQSDWFVPLNGRHPF